MSPDRSLHCQPTASPLHSHEPQIPPALDGEGRCLVCGLLVEIERLREALVAIRDEHMDIAPLVAFIDRTLAES